MSIFGSAYHTDKDSFSSKAFGIAKLGAIITAGIVAKPYLGTFLANSSEKFISKFADTIESGIKWADTLEDSGERGMARVVRRFLQQGAPDSEDGILFGSGTKRNLIRGFDPEAGSILDAVENVRSTTASHQVGTDRISGFLKSIADRLDPSSGPLSQGSVAHKILSEKLGYVARAEGHTDYSRILDSKFISEFTDVAHGAGLKFTDDFYRNSRGAFKEALQESSRILPSRQTIQGTLSQGENRRVVANAIIEHANAVRERTSVNRNLFHPTSTDVTIGDIIAAVHEPKSNPELLAHLENHFTIRRTLDRESTAGGGLKKALTSIENDIRGLFGATDEHGIARDTRELHDILERFKASRSGIVKTRSGKYVNLTEQANIRKNIGNYITSNKGLALQIPVFPGLMDVPVGIFKFAQADAQLVKRLGMLSELPELTRHGDLNKLLSKDSQTQAMALGQRLLTFSEGQFIDHSNKYRVHAVRAKGIGSSGGVRRLRELRSQSGDYSLRDAFDLRPHTGESWLDQIGQNRLGSMGELYFNTRTNNFGIKASSPFLKKILQSGYKGNLNRVAVEDIHPTDLMHYLATHDLGDISPEKLNQALSHVIHQAASDYNDMGGMLGQINLPDRRSNYWLHTWLKNAGDPHAMAEILQSRDRTALDHFFGSDHQATKEVAHSFIDSEFLSKAHEKMGPTLYKAITGLSDDIDAIYEVTGESNGLQGAFQTKWMGRRNTGRGLGNVQKGLLGEVMAEFSVEHLGGHEGLKQALVTMSKVLQDPEITDTQKWNLALKSIEKSSPLLHDRLTATTGIAGHSQMEAFISNIVDANKGEVNIRHMHILATALDEHKELIGAAKRAGGTVAGKVVEEYGHAVAALSLKPETENFLLQRMAHDADLSGVLHERFRVGDPWSPAHEALDPFNSSVWHATLSTGPSPQDFMKDFRGTTRSWAEAGFGAKDFFQSLIDPNKPLGPLASTIQILSQMPQEIAEQVGLGLTAKDRLTTARTVASFYGKRVLPIIGAHYAYKGINTALHRSDLMGIDDMGANLLANVNLFGARMKDMAGLTAMNQSLVRQIPGLDQYFSPRSEEEYRQHLHTGEEEVREGRLWFFGSRSPATGDRIKYVRPNFYRRWKSHWNEMDTEDTYDPNNPYNQVNSRRKDLISGESGLTINSSGEHGALAIGEFGFNLPTSLKGGGDNMTFGSYQGGHGGGGGFGGGGPGVGGVPGVLDPGSSVMGGGGGENISIGFNPGHRTTHGFNAYNFVTAPLHALKRMSGLYGSVVQRLPLYPGQSSTFQEQNPRGDKSFRRNMFLGDYGELGTLNIGEFFRRFVGPDNQALDAPSHLVNDMPSWLPSQFKTGNPYLRTGGIGELNLPGEAYSRANPWARNLRVRGSSIGLSEEEMIRKWLNPTEPLDGADADNIVDFGSAVHLQIQRQMATYGILVGSETSIYDEEHNISGTIDAITRGPNGYELLDIKTQGGKSWGKTPEKYIDQITAYMAITGIKKGHLVFVNRDDPSQIRVEDYAFDPARWKGILNRVDSARNAVGQMVEKGQISPFETYDLLTRIDILSKVAPNSPEYRKAVQFAEESGGFGGFEKERFEQAKRRGKRLSEQHRTYPYRYGVPTENQELFIEDIGPNGEIITELGTVKLAGVNFDKQAFTMEDPESVLAKYGIAPGRMTKMTFVESQANPDVMADKTTEVIIGNANRKLLKAGIGKPDLDSKSPLAYKVLYGDNFMKAVGEHLLHSDNLISNKFLRVRSPLEQFERGEVFGTDRADWDDPIRTIVEPTLSSMAHKNPITAGLQTAFIASLFFGNMQGKAVGATAGLAIGATASLAAKAYGFLTGKEWTPGKYNKQAEFDEYWDTLEFVKYSTLSESAKNKAKKEENTDIDALEASGDRESVALGPWATMAVWADRKAKGTMYGYDEKTGSFQAALNAIPTRHRQIAEEIISYGKTTEKRKFYNLLPDAEKRVLGKFLGADGPPKKPNLTNYFKQHYLPEASWGGWSPKVNDEDLKTRAEFNEDLVIEKPSRSKLTKARAFTSDVPIPKMDHPTAAWITSRINSIIRDGGIHGITAETAFMPSDFSRVNIDMDLFQDQTPELMENVRRQL